MKEEYKLSHLKELEAESIHIIREVAAEFENPVSCIVSARTHRLWYVWPKRLLLRVRFLSR